MEIGSTRLVGRHQVTRAVADRLEIRVRGEISNEDVLQILAALRHIRSECGYSLTLADVTEMDSIPPETRKFAAAEMKRDGEYMSAVAICGASLITRGLITLILRAVSLLGSNARRPLSFPGSWQAGLEWLTRQSVEFQRRMSEPSSKSR